MAFYCDFKTKLRLKILFERTSAGRFSSVNAVFSMSSTSSISGWSNIFNMSVVRIQYLIYYSLGVSARCEREMRHLRFHHIAQSMMILNSEGFCLVSYR